MADKQVDAAAPQAQKSNKTAEQIEEVKKYGIVLGLLVLIWLLGYLDFSISWLLIIFAVWVYKDKTGQSKKLQMKIRSDVVEDEKQAIQAYVADMPSWVYFPDVERAEWLNNIIKQMWPFLGDYVENVLRTTVEPSIKENLPSSLSSFRFETIDLGEKPLRIGGVKVYSEHIKRNEIIMDLDIYYAGDCDIEVGLSRVKAGIEDVQLHGTVRIEMKPLISTVPLIGAMTVYFLNMPELDFNMTNIANILDIPGLSGILRNIIEDQLSQFLVLPNRLVIPITKDVELLKLKFPMPKGVLRIGVEEAKNLMKKDIAVFSKGSSDPYCILHVGGQKFKTETISSTVNPKWEKYFEAIVDEPLGQVVDIELWDEDKGSKDESLGVLSVDIEDIVTKGYIDTWLPLEEAKTGQIHLKLIWLTLSDQVDALEEALEETKRLKALVNQQLASSLLSVKLDSAKDLPKTDGGFFSSKKTITPPSAYCTLSLGHKTKKSKVQKETNDPVWEEAYFFLVQNPSLQSLDVEVLDKKSSKELGKVSVALKQLLDEPDLELEQRFHLEESGPNSFINLKLCLRSIVSPGSKFYGNQIGSVDAVLSPSKGTQSPSNEVASSPAEEPASGNDNEKLDGTSMASSISDAGGVGTSADTTAVINGDMVSAEALAGHTELRRRNVAKSSGEEEDSGLGKVQLTIRYSSQRNKLIVVVHKAENLPPLNSDNTSDPYVRLYLLPDKSKSGRKKTRVIKDELNPVFDETFEFHCNADEAQQRVIDMAVKNSVGMFSQSKSFIGQAYIHLSELDLTKATTVWFPLQGEGSSMDASTPSLASGTAV